MKVPTKYITELEEKEKEALARMMKEDVSSRVRMRAHSILLSNREYSIDEIADIYEVDRDTVSIWISKWEEEKYEALKDQAKSGRPRILDQKEEEKVKELVKQEPRELKRVASQMKKKQVKR